MSHIRFALGFTRNRKVSALDAEAFRLWISSVDYAREQATDGALTRHDLDMIPRCPAGKKRAAVVAELVKSGLWEVDGKGWQIHDFLHWQDSSEQIEEKKAAARERMQRVRANKKRTTSERSCEQHANVQSTFAESSLPVRSGDHPSSTLLSSSENRSEQPTVAGSLAQALELDPETRARQIETDPHSAGWLQPDRWPEVVAVAEAFAVSAGQKPRLGQYARDPGVRAIVAGFAAGFSQDELCRVAGAEWLKSKGLSAMSIEVCRRELGDTGQAKAGASEVGKRAAAAHERRIAAIQKAEREKLRVLVPAGTECGPFDLSKVLG